MSGHIPRLPFRRPAGWNGLSDGQEWAIAPGVAWQARLDPNGRSHVIGHELAHHPQFGPMYASTGIGGAAWHFGRNGFLAACAETREHERAYLKAKGEA